MLLGSSGAQRDFFTDMKPDHGKVYVVCSWSCHGGRNRTNIDNITSGRISTMAVANRPSLPKMGG